MVRALAVQVMVLALAALAAAGRVPAGSKRPNIVWFLTDDQDQMLGSSFPNLNGVTPMPQTKALMQDKGSMATNFFIHTPICCPSRSELLSGRYLHNIKGTGGGCMHVNESKVNPNTFARSLKETGGYTVGMFGKYLNNMPSQATVGDGGVFANGTWVPAGFDAWMGNGGGDYIGSAFNTQNLSFARSIGLDIPDGMWHSGEDVYSTSAIGNISIAWIKHVVKQDPGRPFFAYVAPKAAHEPFNPAPWYRTHWDDSWPVSEPRNNPAWNCSAESRKDHHGNIATQPMLSAQAAVVISDIFKNRWRTLMSVDDAIAGVIGAVEELGLADSTYFFYSSDHGFQLGEFNIPMDKRQPYDWDTRIHLLARGPGIRPGTTWGQPATQVDMAPTFLGLAGIAKPATLDGKSLVPLLMPEAFAAAGGPPSPSAVTAMATPGAATAAHLSERLAAMGSAGAAQYAAGWRTAAFIEHYFVAFNDKCVEGTAANPCHPKSAGSEYPHVDTWCGDLTPGAADACWALYGCVDDCYRTETEANNFIVLRSMPGSVFGDTAYMEFQTGNQNAEDVDFATPDFYELYDTAADPWMMNNTYSTTSAATLAAMHARLREFASCAGDACP